MDNELSLLRRLIALQAERAEWSKRLKMGELTLEKITIIQNEIDDINGQLREFCGY